jgi:hypothetical protein
MNTSIIKIDVFINYSIKPVTKLIVSELLNHFVNLDQWLHAMKIYLY